MAGDDENVKDVQQQTTNAQEEQQQQGSNETLGEKRNAQENKGLVRNKRYKTAKERREHFEKNNTYTVSEEKKPSASEDSDETKEPRLPKKKVALLLGYSGTGYQGMQMNPNAKSIENEVFQALCKAGAISKANSDDPKKSAWMRAARTDKGVHAAGNVLSLKMCFPQGDIVQAINSHLPDQIRVWGYVRVNSAFHAKTCCDSRVYEYLLPTYCFLPPAPKTAGEERRSENDLVMVVDNKERYIARSTPEEMENKRKYRINTETLDKFREALSKFVGTHNYHNYTIGRGFKDRSCDRYIKSIEVAEPMLIQGTEWLSVKLHGQSFMLHQIRKMISMAMLTVRSGTPLSLIDESFKDKRINIPKAPALGLLLERPVFEVYNRKTQQAKSRDPTMRECIDFDVYKDTINDFKQKWIYSKIFEDEQKDAIFDSFLTTVDSQVGPDFKYLNPEGIIPEESIITTKYSGSPAEQEQAKQLDDE